MIAIPVVTKYNASKSRTTIRNIEFEGWVYLLSFGKYQGLEILRYPNHIG